MAKAFMRLIRSPKRKLDINKVARDEIERTLDNKIKPALVKSHEYIVRDWESDIGFAARRVLKADSMSVYVFPTGPDKEIWIYVDQGTKPHTIVPKQASVLRFKTGYEPKTLASPARTVLGGGRATGKTVYAKKVQHPGSEGREFSKQIARDILPEFRKEMENAFRRAARRLNSRR